MTRQLTIVSQFFDPDPSATSYYLSEIAYGLAARGWDVRVLTGQPSYEPGLKHCPNRETRRGVEIRRFSVAPYRRSDTQARLLSQLKFTFEMGRELLTDSMTGPVLVVTCPPFLTWLSLVAKLKRRRLYALIHDIYPEIAVVLGKLSLRLARPWRSVERIALKECAGVIALGRCQQAILRKRLPAAHHSRVTVIPNWAKQSVTRRVAPARRAHPLLTELGISDKFVVMYSGNLGLFHGLEILPKVIHRTDPERYHFVLVGGGQKADWLKEECEQLGLNHVTFLPFQPEDKLADTLSACDVHLVCLHPDATGLCVPSKFYGPLAVGRPVCAVTAPGAEAARVLREQDCGVVAEQYTPEAVTAALERLERDHHLRQQLADNAMAAYQKHFRVDLALDAYDRTLYA